MRVGMGYDVHKLVDGRDLILGGVKIPYEKGLLGHCGHGCTSWGGGAWRYRKALSGYRSGVQGSVQHKTSGRSREIN